MIATRAHLAAGGTASAASVGSAVNADHTHDTDADEIAPVDWCGRPIDCQTCAYQALLVNRQCELGRACVQDRYARRIDRFLRWHPSLANELLTHPYFEVRAIAVRYADVFRLPALIKDPDETVRLQLALRLPARLLVKLSQDVHREVRIRVAMRLEVAELALMQHDEDYYVRQIVARRLPIALLGSMMYAPQVDVRQEVAQRLDMPNLLALVDDPAYEVRRIVAQRLPSGLLHKLAHDADLLVRWEVAQRALPAVLRELLHDPAPEIREVAELRLAEPDHRVDLVQVIQPIQGREHG